LIEIQPTPAQIAGQMNLKEITAATVRGSSERT
jgi:hypothetical protein